MTVAGMLAFVAAAASPFQAPAVSDDVLAEERGGFQLPNGIDIALAVQTQTAIDGAIVLRTVFTVDQGPPVLTVYAPRDGEIVSVNGTMESGTAVAGLSAPTISFDNRNGLQVTPGGTVVPISVSTQASAQDDVVPAGLVAIGGAGPVVTDNGVISQSARNGLQLVDLNAADIAITHFAGSAFGSAIANSANNRAIDTQTTISIDLQNAGPDVLGSAMLRMEGVALDALTRRIL